MKHGHTMKGRPLFLSHQEHQLVNPSTLLGAFLLAAHVIQAQTSNATCTLTATTEWMFNADGHSPWYVAHFFTSTADQTKFLRLAWYGLESSPYVYYLLHISMYHRYSTHRGPIIRRQRVVRLVCAIRSHTISWYVMHYVTIWR